MVLQNANESLELAYDSVDVVVRKRPTIGWNDRELLPQNGMSSSGASAAVKRLAICSIPLSLNV